MSPVCQYCEANDDVVVPAVYVVTGHRTNVIAYACHDDVGAAVRNTLAVDGEEHVRVEELPQ